MLGKILTPTTLVLLNIFLIILGLISANPLAPKSFLDFCHLFYYTVTAFSFHGISLLSKNKTSSYICTEKLYRAKNVATNGQFL